MARITPELSSSGEEGNGGEGSTEEKGHVNHILQMLDNMLRFSGLYLELWRGGGGMGARGGNAPENRCYKIFRVLANVNCLFFLVLLWTNVGRGIAEVCAVGKESSQVMMSLMFLTEYLWVASHATLLMTLLPRRYTRFRQAVTSASMASRFPRTAQLLPVVQCVGYVMLAVANVYILSDVTGGPGDDNPVSRLREFPFQRGSTVARLWYYLYLYYCLMCYYTFFTASVLVCLVCFILGREFALQTQALAKISSPDPESNVDRWAVEEIRLKHEALCRLVAEADNFICFITALDYCCAILVFCFSLFFIRLEIFPGEEIKTIANILLIAVSKIVVHSAAGTWLCEKVNSPANTLLQFTTQGMSQEKFNAINMFLHRLNGPSVGITALGLFTIDKSAALTVFGTVATYSMVVIQLSPGPQHSHHSMNAHGQHGINITTTTIFP